MANDAPARKGAELIGVKKAAQALDVSENRVRQLADDGSLPCIRDSEGRRHFTLRDVLAKKRSRARNATAPRATA